MITKVNIKIVIATIACFIFLVILRDIFTYEITNYDIWFHDVLINNYESDLTTSIMIFITTFGSGIVLVLISCYLFIKNRKIGIYSLTNLIMIFILNTIVKFIVQRPRPSGYNMIVESGYSFPSGHSMVSTAFYGFIIYLIYKYLKSNKLKLIYISILFLLIIFICISRIYLGVHYASDVLGGFFFSIMYLMIFIMCINKKKCI